MKKLMIIFPILLALFVIGIIGAIFTIKTTEKVSLNTVSIEEKKLVKGEKIQRIVVDNTTTDIHVIPTNSKDISVELKGKISEKYKDQYKLAVKENGGEMNITVNDDVKWTTRFGVNTVDLNLEVQLPEKIYQSIEIESSIGDMDFSDIKAKEISLKTNVGDIMIEKSEAQGKFSIQTSIGDLTIKNTKAEQVQIEADTGEIKAEHIDAKTSLISSKIGDVKLSDLKGELDLKADLGDIDIINEVMNGNMKVQSANGDVDIEFKQKPDSLVLDYHSGIGEGVVDLKGMHYEEKSDKLIKGKIGEGKYLLEISTELGHFELH